MPIATNGNLALYYEAEGSGHTVCFVADLGCGPWLWGWQAPALAGTYESVVWDLRASGQSGDGDEYAIETMATDLEAVLAEHGAKSATLVGVGMGGMIALEYALAYSRTDRLVLIGTTAEGDNFDPDAFLGSHENVTGLTSGAFRDAHPDAVDQIGAWREREDATQGVKRAQADAIEAFDVTSTLHEVTEPTLVCHGEADGVVPLEAGETLAEDLPRGRFEPFAEGSHFVFIEQSRLVTDAIAGFLESTAE